MIYFVAAFLTGLIETAFFSLFDRNRLFLVYVFAVNVLTNSVLNSVLLVSHRHGVPPDSLIPPLEAGVVLSEWALLYAYKRAARTKLLVLALIANLLSYGAGLILLSLFN